MSTNETRLHDWHIRLMITDDYDRWRLWKLPSMPSHERKLYHPDEFRQWPTPKCTSYGYGTGWQVGCCMSSGVEIRRNWGPRLGSGGNGSIVLELRTGGKLSIGRSFLLFLLFSTLLHTWLLHWISARYKWCRHGFYHLRISVNGRWSLAGRQVHQKATVRCQSEAGLLNQYEYVRSMIV